eukprot:7277581-Pyramimonas_sp.AAC.1
MEYTMGAGTAAAPRDRWQEPRAATKPMQSKSHHQIIEQIAAAKLRADCANDLAALQREKCRK